MRRARGFFGSLLVFGLVVLPMAVQAAQNCDNNAIVYCGATSRADLNYKIANGDQNPYGRANDLKAIFDDKGLTSEKINRTVDGTVKKNGDVVVGGKVVATGAWSWGRQPIDGSVADGAWWMRPTSVSFVSDNLPAWVNMDGGEFKWAILQACGNLVAANPIKAVVASAAVASLECTALNANPSQGVGPVVVNFSTNVKSVNLTAESYLYDFGDGSTEETTSAAVSHTYTNTGTYTARVRIKSTAGTTDYKTICQKTITVKAAVVAQIIPAVSASTPPPPPPAPAPAPVVASHTQVQTPRTGAAGATGLIGGGFVSYAYSHYKRSKRSLTDALKKQ